MFDLSINGVSFGCTKELNFPETWTIDIVNNTGVHIWDLPIETIWTEKNDIYSSSSIYTVTMGAKFHDNLSPEHLSALNQLLEFLREDTL